MNKLLLSLLGAALLPALTQCNTLEKDIHIPILPLCGSPETVYNFR